MLKRLVGDVRKYIGKEISALKEKFIEPQVYRFFVGTWNFAGVGPPEDTNEITSFLFPYAEMFVPDVMVIGLQEMVPLDAKHIFWKNHDKVSLKWIEILQTSIAKRANMFLLTTKSMVGLFIAVFASVKIKGELSKAESIAIPLGALNGKLGNKGAVVSSFCLNSTKFKFINCHLESGRKKAAFVRRLE